MQTSFLLVSTRKIRILEMSAILILRTKSPQSWFWSPNLEGPVRGPASKSLNAWLLLNWTHYRWVSPNSKTDEETDQEHYIQQTFRDKRLKKSKERRHRGEDWRQVAQGGNEQRTLKRREKTDKWPEEGGRQVDRLKRKEWQARLKSLRNKQRSRREKKDRLSAEKKGSSWWR